ncbi:MAG: tetratricopeptide repeat protein [Bacteroidetes bacterium]|nr:tetratricopeptide repeat protein [Rhodothermia bacterium]MCS7154581.1 tetratricopeptide repeat protein [Bacteroidota bacterium]MCX7906298.1 tetratricopeptide repeat protein [Bacteroidota bacterium]MDW8137374.1 tetratricopeptide repeat protein [Bacteroidota bacterium]MDW8285672.1 tetratricopeptide repeat protein [Bacteroidota bacterium]
MRRWLFALLLGAPAAYAQEPEALSLLGRPLYRPQLAPETRARYEAQWQEAHTRLRADSGNVENWIWLGRRTAYLGRYREAVALYTEAIARFPQDPRLYRHRGHRYITLRQFDRAIEDLERAARLTRGKPDEVEPDGLPNPHGIPTSTLQGNIYYHLGLAYYLKGDFARALAAYRAALERATTDDMRVATLDWLYMSLRRLGRHQEAQRLLDTLRLDRMRILENHAYLNRLRFYRGELSAEALLGPDADELTYLTQGYGVGNYYLYTGHPERARALFERLIQSANWAAFGYIAAEAELARWPRR